MQARADNPERARHQPEIDRVDAYLRVIHALMLRDMRTRFLGSYWGYLIQVLWPVVHMMAVTAALSFRGGESPMGGSMTLFAATGAVPTLAFQYISREMIKGITQNKPLTYYPQVKTLDVMFSRIIVEIVGSIIGVMIIFSVLTAFDIDPIPKDFTMAIGGYVCAIAFGIAIGTINVAIVQFFPGWFTGYALFSILLYMSSGIVFLASDLPLQIYSIMKYNPLVQIVEWVRLGYEPALPISIDYIYMFLWVFVSLGLGLFVERSVSRKAS